MTGTDIRITRATSADAEELTGVMAVAFMADPVSAWLFPDETERARLHPAFFRPFVDMALADGEVYTTEDYAGVTLWLPIDIDAPDEPTDDVHAMFAEAIGREYAKRFAVLDELMTANHPGEEDHYYLPFVAVRPGRQGGGIGGALLQHQLAQLDQRGVAAYLEASCPRNAALYERLGFERMPTTLDLPEGPSLYPMWRRPA